MRAVVEVGSTNGWVGLEREGSPIYSIQSGHDLPLLAVLFVSANISAQRAWVTGRLTNRRVCHSRKRRGFGCLLSFLPALVIFHSPLGRLYPGNKSV
jgi:hypothetical protein